MAKCMNCGNEFEGKRVDAKFCSDVCRVTHNRNISAVSACVTDKTVTDNVTPIRTPQGNIRVSKPGDADYVPQCETTRSYIGAVPEVPGLTVIKPKRGKDIKVFEDLPADVQDTINRMSLVDGKIDQAVKAKRTAAAIKYQHVFPDRYEPTGNVCTGVVTGKSGDADYNGICKDEQNSRPSISVQPSLSVERSVNH